LLLTKTKEISKRFNLLAVSQRVHLATNGSLTNKATNRGQKKLTKSLFDFNLKGTAKKFPDLNRTVRSGKSKAITGAVGLQNIAS
jgi:hypothetical protein